MHPRIWLSSSGVYHDEIRAEDTRPICLIDHLDGSKAVGIYGSMRTYFAWKNMKIGRNQLSPEFCDDNELA